ncbi:hypothetical protein [Nocardia alni]|uniref:hypothetical protein n=1 Tax=Nocardia alni TaxID=2815723 RepID=UPI001C2500B8|nr:hypothetical protein [Nocardia alni]
MDIVIFAGCAMAVLVSWCIVALRITGRLSLRRKALGRKSSRPTPPVSHGPSPGPADTEFTLAWASPTQVWPALTAENMLLAARLSGRITPDQYRARMLELARHCEPHPTAGE